jgi:hypothetical protein
MHPDIMPCLKLNYAYAEAVVGTGVVGIVIFTTRQSLFETYNLSE